MIGECLAERYEITGELGRGGMGVVYRAHDPALRRDVAVKVISLLDLSPEAEERFRREAHLVAQMDHPAIVPIFDLGSHLDALFFVMPVVEGTTLQTLIRRRALGVAEALEIVAQVAEALDHSHLRGVVHRDIKPENIMISRENDRVRARVMDFGLALAGAESRLTQSGKLPGTLIYLSPEQILTGDVDGRSDLYSLGTILFECLAGEPPFSGSRYSLLYRIAHEPPPALGTRGVGDALTALVARCLAKRPDERPQRGWDLAEALRRTAADLESGSSQPWNERLRAAEPPRSMPLVGRHREKEILSRRLEEALAGQCRFVLVGGEAGLGKTRLLQEMEMVAIGRGVRVLQGRFSSESVFPYQGFGEVFQEYFRGRSSSSVSQSSSEIDLGDLGADLLALFPVLNELSSVRELDLGGTAPALSAAAAMEDPTRIFELLARTLIRLASGQPLVLLLEQLHASEASIDALAYIVRRLGPTPTLIVGTYRPSEVRHHHPLRRMLGSFKGDSRVSALELEPLSDAEHGELLGILLASPQVHDELARKLYAVSEGNPLFVQELVRWLLESGDIRRSGDGTWRFQSDAALAQDALPESIQQAVEARLEQLPAERLEVLRVASILGRSFDFADLEALVGQGAEAAVDELVRDALLEEDPGSRDDRLIFTSRLVRKMLRRTLSRRRRRSLHRRHAEHLEARYAGRLHRVRGQLVHHFAEGDVPGKTIRYALETAREALSGFAWEAAIRVLRTALELVEDETVDGAVEGELRRLLASAHVAEGQLEAAFREAIRAERAAERAGDGCGAGEAALQAAEIAWQGRKVDAARQWVARGREIAVGLGADSESAGELRRRLATLGATLANLGGEHSRARALLAEAAALDRASGVGEAEPAPLAGGTLVTSLPGAIRSYELGQVPTPEELEVLGVVAETLLGTDEQGNLHGILGRHWEGSSEGKAFRVVLRQELSFSDGSPLTAADVRTAFEAAARRGGASPAPALAALKGIESLLGGDSPHIDGIEVVSETEICFHLHHPLPIFPALLTDLRTAVVRPGKDGTLVGTGPFRLGARPSGELSSILLERNPRWRGEKPPLDRLEFRVLASSAEVARGLRSGELDVGRDLSPEDFEEILRDPRFRAGLVESVQKNVCFTVFHTGGPAAKHREVRRALAGLIDVRDFVWRTLGRAVQPATGVIPPGILGHDPGQRHELVPREEARAILAAAGVERLRGAIHPVISERYSTLVGALLDAWSSTGVAVDLEPHTFTSFLERARSPEGLDFCVGRWVHDYDDPDNFTRDIFHSRHGQLAGYLDSPHLDPWIERARHELRPAARQQLYGRIEGHLAREAIVLPLFYDIQYRIRSPTVRGLRLKNAPPFVNYHEIGKSQASENGPAVAPRLRQIGSIQVPLTTEVLGLEPDRGVFVEIAEVTLNVFETLTRIEEGAHVVPALASEFRVEEGGRRYRFRLRQNVRFHDGRRLTARDVRFSFERLLRSPHPGAAAPLLPLVGARAFRDAESEELAGFQVVSERELVLDLERPLSFFPAMLSSPTTAIVPDGARRFNANWREGTAGTGPFRVVRLKPSERLELEANPSYWRPGLPRCDRLVFELALSRERILDDFRAGRLALAARLSPGEVDRLQRQPELASVYREAPGFSTYYLALNLHRPAFAESTRRRALAGLVEGTNLVRATLGRVAIPAQGLIPPGLLGQEGPPPPTAEIGAEELRGWPLRCAVHPAYRETFAPFWEGLQEVLVGAGIELDLVPLAPAEVLQARGDVDLVVTRWQADYPDSDAFVQLLHSRDGLDGHLCGNEEIDSLLARGRIETDPHLRHAIYHEIEQILRREALIVPLFHEQIYRFARPEVSGLRLRLGLPEVAYEELCSRP